MASYAIFQYNVLAIDDTHNTWTNMIVKIIILRLLGSSDDKEKEKIDVARPEGPPLRGSGQRPESSSDQEHRKNRCLSIGASDACRKNRRYEVWCRRESKPSQPIGTG